ncbi:MAG: hypothetical protein ACLP52_01130 [Streptosporangiaceae bacterium]
MNRTRLIRNRRRAALPRRVLVLAVAAALPALAGCEAGPGAPTQHWHQPTPGATTMFHDIAIRNVFTLGTAGSGTLPAGHSAGLFLGLVNTGTPDKLIGISAPSAAKKVVLATGPISLPSQKDELLTGPIPKAVLTGLTRSLTAGQGVNVTLTFQNAGSVTLRVPVMAKAQYYSTYSAAPSPSASPKATSPAGKHHHKTKGPATPSASPSAAG